MSRRVKGFADWTPNTETRALLDDVEAVLEEYADYLPLTLRQVFYRLVGGHGYEKTERLYARLGDHLVRARRAGIIPFDAIRDDGISRRGGRDGSYVSPAHYYRAAARLHNFYARPWHEDQPRRVLLLAEAAGIVPILAGVADEYRLQVASSGGFDSPTVKHDLYADARLEHDASGRPTLLLHCGDLDGSGVWMYRSMSEDLDAFGMDDGMPGILTLERVALTPDQRDRLGVISDPRPKTASHDKAFNAEGLGPAAQLEAVPPDVLTDLVRHEVESALDMDALAASKKRERDEYAEVGRKLEEVNRELPGLLGTG